MRISALILSPVLFLVTCSQLGVHSEKQNKPILAPSFEKIASMENWGTPLWGEHAPKIVKDRNGIVYVLGQEGPYPGNDAIVYKRLPTGEWVEGARFKETYQPSIPFLDQENRLNVLTNSQTNGIRHYRSTDDQNLNQFVLIAEGNGHAEDPRGFYPGIGIRNDTLYMAYITNDYDFWLTWKCLEDSLWAPAILLYDGYADPKGNHAMLYPRFTFSQDTVYLLASHCSDGSTYNFKDAVYLYQFRPSNPQTFTLDPVYAPRKGYSAFGFNVSLGSDNEPVVIMTSGGHQYGPVDSTALPAGLYRAKRFSERDGWMYEQIYSGPAVPSEIHLGEDQFIILNANDWAGNGSLSAMFESGKDLWQRIPISWPWPDSTRLFPSNLQFTTPTSGSSPGSGADGVLAVSSKNETGDGLHSYDLYYVRMGK